MLAMDGSLIIPGLMNPTATAAPSKITVPYVNLPLQMRRVKAEVLSAIERVLESGTYILGPEVQEFEKRFAEYCGTKFAVGLNSGMDALFLVLKSMGIGPGDEVITVPNSFIASAACIAQLGAKPVFVDVREDLNLDPALLEKAITPRTKAILPVHLTGRPADMKPILEVAARRNLPVVEDAAQAVGATYHGKRVGSFGLAGCFSLHPLKNLHAFGDAGAVTTNDEKLHQHLLKLRNHGLRNRDECEFWGFNSRLDTIQAAALIVKLQHLEEWTEERRRLAHEYNTALQDVVGVPVEGANTRHVYQTYVILAERRDELQQHLRSRGVDAKIHYPVSLFQQEAAQSLACRNEDVPVAATLGKRILSLPLFPEMTREQVQTVIDGVRSFYRP